MFIGYAGAIGNIRPVGRFENPGGWQVVMWWV